MNAMYILVFKLKTAIHSRHNYFLSHMHLKAFMILQDCVFFFMNDKNVTKA